MLISSADHISPSTGKTPTVTVSKAGGAFAAVGGTVTEVSGGWYKIVLTTIDTGTLGDLAFHVTEANSDNTDFVDQVTTNILGDTLPVADPLLSSVPGTYAAGTAGAALGKLGSAQITTVSPLSSTGALTLVRGDDYLAVDNRSLDFLDVSANWPDLTGAIIRFALISPSGVKTIYTGSVVTASGANKKVRVEPTALQTAALTADVYGYDIEAQLTNGHFATLTRGLCTITADVNPT